MALKNWEKINKGWESSDNQIFINKDKRNWIVTISEITEEGDSEVFDVKLYKSKIKALEFVKQYMKTH